MVYLGFEWMLCWVCGCLFEFLLVDGVFLYCVVLVSLIVLGSSLFYVAEFVTGTLVDCVSFIVFVWVICFV